MKLEFIQNSLSIAVIPLITFTLLPMLLMSCGREDAPKKEEPKVEAVANSQKTDQKPEDADDRR